MGDQLVMHEDGTVTIGWGEFSTTLREPTIGEWLSFVQEKDRAETWARGEQDAPAGEEPTPKLLKEAAEDGPYLKLYGRMIRELGIGLTGEAPDLPPWLAAGDVFTRISNWWSANPLSRREAAAVTRTLTQ